MLRPARRFTVTIAAVAGPISPPAATPSVITNAGIAEVATTLSSRVPPRLAHGAAYDSLKRFPIPPCQMCGKEDMKPGEQHTCVLRTTPMPHEVAAQAFQRQGSAAALAADLEEITGSKS